MLATLAGLLVTPRIVQEGSSVTSSLVLALSKW